MYSSQRPSIEVVGEWYSVAHGYLSLNEVTKDHDIFYYRPEFLQPELMLGLLLPLKNIIPHPQSLQCNVVRRRSEDLLKILSISKAIATSKLTTA